MSQNLEHLVFVRHAEGEGDVRRRAWQAGEVYETKKMPEEESLTEAGWQQSKKMGLWIREHILGHYCLTGFEEYRTSPALRAVQSATGLELTDKWKYDASLDERKRGLVSGLSPQMHEEKFPNSYAEMKRDPVNWVPPEGESIVDLVRRAGDFLSSIRGVSSGIFVTHRDFMWAAMAPLEKLSLDDLTAIDTNAIDNGYAFHYTSINPDTRQQSDRLRWVRKVSPFDNKNSPSPFRAIV